MRIMFFCILKKNKRSEGIASYLMPQGDQRGAGWQFYDASYDGIWDGSLLRQGLGQLTDGKLGPDNFKASYYDQDRGKDNVQVPVYSCGLPPYIHGFFSFLTTFLRLGRVA